MIAKPLIKFKIPKISRKKEALRSSSSFTQATSIGIIYCSGSLEKHQRIKSFISSMEQMGKHVEVITYLEKGKDNHEFMFKYFTAQDISFWGNFKNNDVLSFSEKKLDFLFCFDFSTNLYTRYILSLSNAKCRIGPLEDGGDRFFELMIKPQAKTIENLIDTMSKYAQSIS